MSIRYVRFWQNRSLGIVGRCCECGAQEHLVCFGGNGSGEGPLWTPNGETLVCVGCLHQAELAVSRAAFHWQNQEARGEEPTGGTLR